MNKSVHKALQILELFTDETRELSLNDISKRLNMPKPTAYRLVTTLETRDYLMKIREGQDGSYRLGLKLLELGQLVSNQLEIREHALPIMQDLVKNINEAVHLVVVRQNEAVYIEKVDSTRTIRLYTRVGKRSPLHIGSGPKLLLAFLENDKQKEILKELDEETKKRLQQEIKDILKQGYAFSEGEQDANTIGISYPIYNYKNAVIASLTVSGLSSYFTEDNLQKIKHETKYAAYQISKKMGYLK
ncbi:DNA-binding IclR family transcriptional regulator [Cerasibacillus quisquiliarum]|uniref:Glycerol operon regulatory protein n=1 Tax=Cerasibacillus quisquiliarum TaxID=227865 RepID=A0A511UXK9_9BACI|nr:IclR family transcriptional regulator [Cerasibacillus quisquiliarum]MBB5146667.1 DNA-binding IclR family transcriptional regulator [Cerasibacillus quisquiliarum]GEN31365.1 HTH-type transcriptional regulator KipR [Cerasibacillus quisquiliarum]